MTNQPNNPKASDVFKDLRSLMTDDADGPFDFTGTKNTDDECIFITKGEDGEPLIRTGQGDYEQDYFFDAPESESFGALWHYLVFGLVLSGVIIGAIELVLFLMAIWKDGE